VLAAVCGLLGGTGLVAPAARGASWIAQVPRQDGGTSSAGDLKHQLDDLRETLEGTSKSLVDAVVSLRQAQSDSVDATAKLDVAHSALALAQARDDVLSGQLAVAEGDVEKARHDLQSRQVQETATRDRLGSIARETYVSSGLAGLSIALGAQSPSQFADRVDVAGTVLMDQNTTIARLEVQQAETRARQSRLTAVDLEVAGLKQQSDVVVQQRSAAESAAAAATSELSRLVAVEQRSVRTIAARKSAEQQRVTALQVQADQLAVLLKRQARAHERAAHLHSVGSGSAGSSSGNGSGRLSYPVNGPITSGFGMRFHPILHIWLLHSGTDFGVPCGTPVHAAAPGRIVRTGWAGGYGNQVVIDHGMIRGQDIASSYNHLSRYVVRSGVVKRGQVIAYSGTTGLSTGCHLHFEVYVNGTHINPMGWL
jgi:murein DD-endopeptidase MepM/ murein hydrolase activator NlpD